MKDLESAIARWKAALSPNQYQECQGGKTTHPRESNTEWVLDMLIVSESKVRAAALKKEHGYLLLVMAVT